MKIKIKIQLSETKEVELTEDKARELYFKLHEYFGNKDNYIPYPVYPQWPTFPPVTYSDSGTKIEYPIITCEAY